MRFLIKTLIFSYVLKKLTKSFLHKKPHTTV
jgi:hypothetical protein